ncbi:MAG TPA: hypothetical protein VH137_07520 [Gemmatimonadales bacterium]|nr:hypothetical protein [Gemmatimonadales bacterium]
MPFATSPVKDTLEGYLAGRVNAERVVIALAAAYYGRDGGRGTRDGLGPLIEVIDRASPGIVELESDPGRAGFGIRLAERPFPPQYEVELRQAVESYLASARTTGVIAAPPASGPSTGVVARIVGAIRRLFLTSG